MKNKHVVMVSVLALSTILSLTRTELHAAVTVLDISTLKANHLNVDLYPMFLQSSADLHDPVTGSFVVKSASRCGYMPVGGGAAYRDEITELTLFNPNTGYLATFQKIDGNDLGIIKDSETGQFHMSGVVGGAYVGKLCQAFESETGLASQCVRTAPRLPQAYLRRMVSSAEQVCTAHMAEAAAQGGFNPVPPQDASEKEQYLKRLRMNITELGK